MTKNITINQAITNLEEQSFNLKEDKAILKLSNGTLEMFFEEGTLKTQFHDMNVYVSEELIEKDLFETVSNFTNMISDETEEAE